MTHSDRINCYVYMARNYAINFSIGAIIGLFAPTIFGIVTAYTPLQASTFLYLSSCGHEPVASQSTTYCKYINMFFLGLYDFTNIFPVSLLLSFLVIQIQRHFAFQPLFVIFSFGYILALTFQNYLISYNPFYSALSFFLTIVSYGSLLFAYLILLKLLGVNTLNKSLKDAP